MRRESIMLIQTPQSQEAFLRDLAATFLKNSWIHERYAIGYTVANTVFAVLSAALSIIVSAGLVNEIVTNDTRFNKISQCVVMFLSSLLSALQPIFGFANKISAHTKAYVSYMDLHVSTELQLSLEGDDKMNYTEFVKSITQKYESLLESSPLPCTFQTYVYRQLQIKYRNHQALHANCNDI